MKRILISLVLIFSFNNYLDGQIDTDVVVIDLEDDTTPPESKFIKEIRIKRKFLIKTLGQLRAQAVDSAKIYRGNCLKITHFDNNESLVIKKGYPDYLRARIYHIENYEQKHRIKDTVKRNKYIRDSLLINRKTTADYQLILGYQDSGFNLKKNRGYNLGDPEDWALYGSFFFHINRVFESKKVKRLKYHVGIGGAKNYLGIYPLVSLKETGIVDVDSVKVGKVGYWDYSLLVPISLSYELPNIYKKGFGVRFFVGVENSITLYRSKTESILTTNFDPEKNIGDLYEDENLNKKVNDYFSELVGPYSLRLNAGIGLIKKERGSGGVKYTHMYISPFKKGQKINKQYGFLIFLEIPLFDIKK